MGRTAVVKMTTCLLPLYISLGAIAGAVALRRLNQRTRPRNPTSPLNLCHIISIIVVVVALSLARQMYTSFTRDIQAIRIYASRRLCWRHHCGGCPAAVVASPIAEAL